MPTGYTAEIYEGKDVTFKQFASRCARAFGALVHLRDEPLSNELPTEISEESKYHTEGLKNAKALLAKLKEMSEKEKVILCDKSNKQAYDSWFELDQKRRALLDRYTDMLNQAKTWTPPTPDHNNFKAFMIEQLESSIKFDCNFYDPPAPLSVESWYAREIENAKDDIEYHERGLKEEQARVNKNLEWIKHLAESIENV